MALQLFVDSVSQVVEQATFNGRWQGAEVVGCSGGPPNVQFQFGYDQFNELTPEVSGNSETSGTWNSSVSVDPDRTAKVRAIGVDCASQKQSSNTVFKTLARGMSMFGLTPGIPTTTSCVVTGGIIPNCIESSAQVTIQYKVSGSSVYTETGAIAQNLQGESFIGLSGQLTGLLPGTTYLAVFSATRNTANGTEAFSSVGTFTTLADGPPKVIVVPAAAVSTGRLNLGTQVSARTVQAPLMGASSAFIVIGIDITSPELTKYLDLIVFVVDAHPISADMD